MDKTKLKHSEMELNLPKTNKETFLYSRQTKNFNNSRNEKSVKNRQFENFDRHLKNCNVHDQNLDVNELYFEDSADKNRMNIKNLTDEKTSEPYDEKYLKSIKDSISNSADKTNSKDFNLYESNSIINRVKAEQNIRTDETKTKTNIVTENNLLHKVSLSENKKNVKHDLPKVEFRETNPASKKANQEIEIQSLTNFYSLMSEIDDFMKQTDCKVCREKPKRKEKN